MGFSSYGGVGSFETGYHGEKIKGRPAAAKKGTTEISRMGEGLSHSIY